MQVAACNSLDFSQLSEPYKFTFDGETNVVAVKDLKVASENEDNITFVWKYDEEADGFSVHVYVDRPYPHIPPNVTKTRSLTMKLAPGVNYRITVIVHFLMLVFCFFLTEAVIRYSYIKLVKTKLIYVATQTLNHCHINDFLFELK